MPTLCQMIMTWRTSDTVVGIDYGMSSPAMCVLWGNKIDLFYWTTKRKYECHLMHDDLTILGIMFDTKHKQDEERFDYMARQLTDKSLLYTPRMVILEDYSYASTGRAFQIGENAGVLKNYFWNSGWDVTKVAPTTVKKFATGKGNADKEMMQNAFIAETGLDLKKLLGQTESQWNPSSDLIDAYWIAQYGRSLL